MFPDVELVRSIQTELDEVIQEGVANIVQLLRNTDSGTSSSATRAADDDDFEVKNRMKNKFRKWNHDISKAKPGEQQKEVKKGQGQLTDQLITKGLLTKSMLKELKREWGASAAAAGKSQTKDEK